MLLRSTTFISNKNALKEQEDEYHQKIKNWLKDISKVKYCKELLDVVNQCENLKIIFDFESELVDDVALFDFTASKFPFTDESISVNAKLSTTRTEQEIKGVLARELCRYALCLTYGNTSHPYYKHNRQATQNFNEIIKTIINWTSEDSSKSNKIIKSVISTSTPDTIQMDLISSMIQTLVQFDNDKEELTRFEVKFKILFDYFENFVLPEMKKLNLKFRENVRKFNKMADILPSILNLKLELSELKDVKSLTELNFSIIQTNFPKLFLINIQKCLGTLFDVQNIFISADKLQSQELHDLLTEDPNLNVFVICSGKIDENLTNIFTSKLTFIVSDDVQCLAQQLTESGLSPTKVEVNYGWNDLTIDSQKLLLKMKINFQNNSEFSFLDILKDEFHPEDEEVVRNFNDIVDDQLLGLMIEGSGININSGQEDLQIDEQIFQERKFKIRKFKKHSSEVIEAELSAEEFLESIEQEKFVLIMNESGSGKTWLMRKYAKIFNKQNPTNWLTFVDLERFNADIKDLMTEDTEFKFLQLITDCIKKSESTFESKIFTKMYKFGKVFIFFDGFDELDPKCAEFVAKFLKSFEYNEGNQLWIASRANFEVEIFQPTYSDLSIEYRMDDAMKFKLNVSYEIVDFTDKNCADLISTCWSFDEIRGKVTKSKHEADLKNSDNWPSYQQIAMNLLNKNSNLKFGPIGMPKLCKMIAEITKNDRFASTELTELKIYKEFTQNLQKKWQKQQDSGTETQNLNFWMFHELMAMESLFPSYSDFIDQNLEDVKTLKDKSILAKSLLTKTGQNFDFFHSTFRDFFVAEFILRILRKDESCSKVSQFLMKILTIRRHEVVRLFLNQGFEDLPELSSQKIKMIALFIDESTDLSHVFGENLENIQSLIIEALKRKRYEVTKAVLIDNFDRIFDKIKNSKKSINPKMFLDFFTKFLRSECLKKLLISKPLFSIIIESCEDIEHFGKFINDVKVKFGAKFVSMALDIHRYCSNSNILSKLCNSKNVDRQKVQKLLKILKNILNIPKLITFMTSFESVLYSCIHRNDAKVLKIILTEIESFFAFNEQTTSFRQIFTYEHADILEKLDYCDHLDIHEAFYKLLFKNCRNS